MAEKVPMLNVLRWLRLGPLHQLHPGRSRSLVRHHYRLHMNCPLLICLFNSRNWIVVTMLPTCLSDAIRFPCRRDRLWAKPTATRHGRLEQCVWLLPVGFCRSVNVKRPFG